MGEQADEGGLRRHSRRLEGRAIARQDLDELGYLPMDATSAHWMFQVVSRRYERGSIDSAR